MPARRLKRLVALQLRLLTNILLLRPRPPRVFGWLVWAYLGGILLVTFVLVLPPVRSLFSCWLAIPKNYADPESREWVKDWCDAAIILFQIGLAISVGGVVFTERLVDFIRQRTMALQNAIDMGYMTPDIRERRRRLARFYWAMKALEIRIGTANNPPSIFEIMRTWSRHTGRVLEDLVPAGVIPGGGEQVPFLYRIFLFKFAVSFPGGFYGLAAFLMFEGLLLAQVVKTYFDYISACSN
jgi:hypothetical protein